MLHREPTVLIQLMQHETWRASHLANDISNVFYIFANSMVSVWRQVIHSNGDSPWMTFNYRVYMEFSLNLTHVESYLTKIGSHISDNKQIFRN